MSKVVVFLKAGTTSWEVPPGVTSVFVECVGSGGNGARVTNSPGTSNRRNGGGAGAYAASQLTVGPGTIPVNVAAAATQGLTWFGSTTTVAAAGGANGVPATRGLGGSVANSAGDIIYSGGAGGSSASTGAGGGGGAGSPLGDGVTGGSATGGGGAGGGAVGGGGAASGSSGGAPPGSTTLVALEADGGNGGGGGGVSGGNFAIRDAGRGGQYEIWIQTSNGEVAGPGGGGGGGGTAGGSLGYGGAGGGGGDNSGPSANGRGSPGIIVITYYNTLVDRRGARYMYFS